MSDTMAAATIPLSIDATEAPPMSRAWVKPMQVATIAVGLSTLALAVKVISSVRLIGTYHDIETGTATGSTITSVEDQFGAVALAATVLFVIAGLATMVGLHRLASALRDHRVVLEYSPRWAYLAWLVPGLNLWRPYQLVKDLDRATRRTGMVKQPDAGLWWGLMLVGGFFAVQLGSPTPQTSYAVGQFATSLVFTVGGAMLVLILRRMTTAALKL